MKAFTIFILLLISFTANSAVEPPNYNFKIADLDIFYPGKKLEDIEKKYGKGQMTSNNDPYKIYKFKVKNLRYTFSLWVQTKNKIVTDFYTKLPDYFLHNVFHQSIITHVGAKQDVYKKIEEQALYIWENQKDLRHVYSGGCTITCFPIYYSVMKTKKKWDPDYKPYHSIIEAKFSKKEE